MKPTVRLGLIGYGAIGKHIEAAGLENIDLVSVLVKRPRNDGRLIPNCFDNSRSGGKRSPGCKPVSRISS